MWPAVPGRFPPVPRDELGFGGDLDELIFHTDGNVQPLDGANYADDGSLPSSQQSTAAYQQDLLRTIPHAPNWPPHSSPLRLPTEQCPTFRRPCEMQTLPQPRLGSQDVTQSQSVGSLPRQKSRYSLHDAFKTRPIQIPSSNSPVQEMNPMQRWQDSPPETEPASASAIFNALQHKSSFYDVAGPSLDTAGGMGTGAGSSPSMGSGSSCGSSSVASSRSVASRSSRRTRAGRVSKKHPKRSEKPGSDARVFCCTFCCDTFTKKYDWTRHEQTHHLNCDQWVCAPFGASVASHASNRSHCAYCNLLDPTPEHIRQHNHDACHNSDQQHIFRRKDHLIQHLRGFHQLEILPIIEDWKIEPPVITSRCGFCGQRLESWIARADHLADHFRQGKTMADWRGDHAFEPLIAAQVRNAIPPYLLFNEARTVVPFSATDHTVSDHLSQMVLEHQGFQTLPSHQPTHMLQAAPHDQRVLNPGFEVTPTTYTNFLAWHLGRFAQRAFGQGICPTDQMFQDEARRLVYGNDDNWEQTIADNTEWLDLFRRNHMADEGKG